MVSRKKQPKKVVSPAVEGDVPVLVDSEKHGGGGERGQAGELTLAHLLLLFLLLLLLLIC